MIARADTPLRLFAAALALTVVHAVDDAFVSLEPGVGPADHLVSGLVVLALLAAAALGWPRLRDGWRGALALALAATTIVGFALALAGGSRDGLAGDEWTGLLLGPAAAAFLAAGAAVLWRSRRADGHWLVRRGLRTVAGLVVAFEVVAPVLLAVYATHRPRDAGEPLVLGAPATEVRLTTSDGLRIAASHVPSHNGATIVLYPRRGGSDRQARMLVRNGFGVLSLDARGYGESEGDPNAFGWRGARDIDAAVAWLRERGQKVGALGLSVGGEVLIDAASRNDGLGAVVSEGAGERSIRETLIRGAKGALMLPHAAVLTTATAVLSNSPPPPALDDAAAGIAPRALMLIEAGRGGGGEDLNRDYFDAATGPKEHWRVEEATHTGGIEAEPEEYERRVVGFFERHL